MKILIAEDESIMRKTVGLKLEKEGYTVIDCVDGKEALEKIETESPDVVITDIMLPYASGLEIIKAAKEKNTAIAVIVLSALGQEKTVEEAFELGADDYITKPFNLNELAIRVKRLLKKNQ
jgi:DNA-binding response OmpR family regulator